MGAAPISYFFSLGNNKKTTQNFLFSILHFRSFGIPLYRFCSLLFALEFRFFHNTKKRIPRFCAFSMCA